MFAVSRSGRFGFIDRRGKLVIPLQFDGLALPFIGGPAFSEGLAPVCLGKCDWVYPEGYVPKRVMGIVDDEHRRYEAKWGYINTRGQMIISPRFTDAGRFVNGRAPVATGERWLDSPDALHGYIDSTATLVIPEQFESAGEFDKESGLAVVCVGTGDQERCGYIDTTGRFAVNPQFNAARPASGCLVPVWFNRNESPSYVDRAGKVIWRGEYAENKELYATPKTLRDATRFPVFAHNKWGFIDCQGKLAIGLQFDSVEWFSEGLAPVCVGPCTFVRLGGGITMHQRYEGKWGSIDDKGQMVINPRFSVEGKFVRGRASVSTQERWLDQPPLLGYIDPRGSFVVSEQFDSAGDFDGSSGLAVVCLGGGNNARCGYIDPTGEFVINPQFFRAFDFNRGLAVVNLAFGAEDSYVSGTGQLVWKGDDSR